jgi:hypothetical protein
MKSRKKGEVFFGQWVACLGLVPRWLESMIGGCSEDGANQLGKGEEAEQLSQQRRRDEEVDDDESEQWL